ncbi:MAG: hypothetical protein LBI69_02190 [Puniceicoccales bacterium]|nr:hypothetical protein [Puniceicoccales bacterium]
MIGIFGFHPINGSKRSGSSRVKKYFKSALKYLSRNTLEKALNSMARGWPIIFAHFRW